MSDTVPLGLVIAASPFQVIVILLLLLTPRARAASASFLAGWCLGITGATTSFLLLADVLDVSDYTPTWVSWTRVIVGLALISFGARKWMSRHKSAAPTWMESIGNATPARAVRLGATVSLLNPKVVLIAAAAGLSIGAAGLSATGQVTSVLVFTLVASSTVLVPVGLYLAMGTRVLGPLGAAKDWLESNNAVVMAVVLVAIGAALLTKGILEL